MRVFKAAALLLTAILLLSACGVYEPAQTLSDAQILAQRRDLVEADMRSKMTVLWRAKESIEYSVSANSLGPEQDDPDDVIKIVAGRVYRGMPYSHGRGSQYSFLSFADSQESKGIYNISGLNSAMLNGDPNDTGWNRARISSDCSSSVFWSWAKVSNSIFFNGTKRMTEEFGCLKVGSYTAPKDSYDKTTDICKDNGMTVMAAAYAQLQKADAVVTFNKTAGHAMMIVSVNVVKNGDGIDPDKSTVTVLDQISGNLVSEKYYFDETLNERVYLCGRVDHQFTFRGLYSAGYLPVTCKELVDPSPLAEETVTDSEKTHTKDNILDGVFTASHVISSVTVTITDANGETVQQVTGMGVQTELLRFRLKRMADKEEADVLKGSLNPDALPPGTYRCTHVCQIATGKQITVRDFQFTV